MDGYGWVWVDMVGFLKWEYPKASKLEHFSIEFHVTMGSLHLRTLLPDFGLSEIQYMAILCWKSIIKGWGLLISLFYAYPQGA